MFVFPNFNVTVGFYCHCNTWMDQRHRFASWEQ